MDISVVSEMIAQMGYTAPLPAVNAIDIATMIFLAGPFAAYCDGPDILIDGRNGSSSTFEPGDLERIGQDILTAPITHAELETLAALVLTMEFCGGMLLDKVVYLAPDGLYRTCDPADIRNLGLQMIENNDPEGSDSFSIWTRIYPHPAVSDLDAAVHHIRTRRNAFIARSSSGAVVAATFKRGNTQFSATAEQLMVLGSYIHDSAPNAYDRFLEWLVSQPKADDTVTFSHAYIKVSCRMADMPRVACLIDASDFDLLISPEQMARLFPGRPELHTLTPLADALLQIGGQLMEG